MASTSQRDSPHERPANPRVLHVVAADTLTRFGSMFRQLGLALSVEGIGVTMLTDDAAMVAELEGTPIRALRADLRGGWHTWRLGRLLTDQLQPAPQVIHAWGEDATNAVADWATREHCPVIPHCCSLADVRWLTWRRLAVNEHPAAICAEFANMLRDCWPTLSDRVQAYPPCLLPAADAEPPTARGRALGVLWTGRIDRDAGLGVLLRAIAKLVKRRREVQLALLGGGPRAADVWRLAQACGVREHVSMVDDARLWERAIRGADCLVAPAAQEDISLAPLLAMSAARIVIACRGQHAEWFREGETSLQFERGALDELTDLIEQAAEGRPHALAVARSASAYVRREHSVPRLADRLIERYRALAERRVLAGGGERT